MKRPSNLAASTRAIVAIGIIWTLAKDVPCSSAEENDKARYLKVAVTYDKQFQKHYGTPDSANKAVQELTAKAAEKLNLLFMPQYEIKLELYIQQGDQPDKIDPRAPPVLKSKIFYNTYLLLTYDGKQVAAGADRNNACLVSDEHRFRSVKLALVFDYKKYREISANNVANVLAIMLGIPKDTGSCIDKSNIMSRQFSDKWTTNNWSACSKKAYENIDFVNKIACYEKQK